MPEHQYVCSKCGHEQDSMDRPCDACGSVRVVLVSVIAELFGSAWRSTFAKVVGK
jgi:predicted nucleic acid-binding Zn ribbon protein